jgi:hypothetical protein
VCGEFFSAASGFTLEATRPSRLASTRRESAGETGLLTTCWYLLFVC